VIIDIAGAGSPSASIQPLFTLLENVTCLIGNSNAIASRDLSAVCGPLINGASQKEGPGNLRLPPPIARGSSNGTRPTRDVVRVAVPDGHQQRHVVEALREAGLAFEGYGDGQAVRRPNSEIEGLEVKVIRPQDMASLVATGEMDIAITGRDCLLEHRYAFPSSPVVELLDLQRGQYNLSAVVTEDLSASTIEEAMGHWREQGKAIIRVASEFPVTADHYARSRHFWRYQVIPISGASEGFVPEDADLLIEGTETGKTLRENRLKAIDLLYRSTTCVIGHREPNLSEKRRRVYDELLAALGRAEYR
jgi:ATP phosphoribosyltransferase